MGLKSLLKYKRKQGAVSDKGDKDFASSSSQYEARPWQMIYDPCLWLRVNLSVIALSLTII